MSERLLGIYEKLILRRPVASIVAVLLLAVGMAFAATLQEESDTLVDVIEPYLLKIGFITRTSSGRKASEDAFRHLGFKVQTHQVKMF